MGTVTNKLFGGLGEYKPFVTVQKLSGCPNCHAPHPLARKPQMPADRCPDCSMPLPQVEAAETVEAALFLPWPLMFIARLFGQIGAWLYRLAERIDPQ